MSKQSNISLAIKSAVEAYFSDLEGETAHGIHSMVIELVEKALIEDILERCDGNQGA